MQDQLNQLVAYLEAAGLKVRSLFDIHLSTGVYLGWWDEAADWAHNHNDGTGLITYRGRNGLSNITPYTGKIGMEVMSLEVTLSGMSGVGRTMAQDKTWRQRQVRWWIAVFDAQTSTLVNMVPRFTGIADTVQMTEQPGGETEIKLNCESFARAYNRSTQRYRTHEDQQALIAHIADQFTSGQDKVFEYVGKAAWTPVAWGKAGRQYIGKGGTWGESG